DFRVVLDVEASRTEMYDSPANWTLLRKTLQFRHQIMPDVDFNRQRPIDVEIVCVRFDVLQLFGRDNANRMLSTGERDPYAT
ncbi:hypothetical protein ABTP03_19795, partial [Acinetobacter baumannii]